MQLLKFIMKYHCMANTKKLIIPNFDECGITETSFYCFLTTLEKNVKKF